MTEHQADESWDEHYADERDAAWLYRELARVDKNRERADLFGRRLPPWLSAHDSPSGRTPT